MTRETKWYLPSIETFAGALTAAMFAAMTLCMLSLGCSTPKPPPIIYVPRRRPKPSRPSPSL